MRVHEISNYNQQINSKGKLSIPFDFSEKEKDLVNKVMNSVVEKRSNSKILSKKSYDVWMKRNAENNNLLEFWTTYDEIWANKPINYFLSFVHTDKPNPNGDILNFRHSLGWFENYKKQHGGFNTFGEKIIAGVKDFLAVF